MAKKKRKLSKAEKLEKKRRRELYEWVFINGKQKRVKRAESTVEGLTFEDYCRADPLLAHQEEMWHLLDTEDDEEDCSPEDPKTS